MNFTQVVSKKRYRLPICKDLSFVEKDRQGCTRMCTWHNPRGCPLVSFSGMPCDMAVHHREITTELIRAFSLSLLKGQSSIFQPAQKYQRRYHRAAKKKALLSDVNTQANL